MFLNDIFKNIRVSLLSAPQPPARGISLRFGGFSRSIEMSATLRNLEGQDEAGILREIQAALQGLKFGSVEITVHNGQVVQIERKEKFRLNPSSSKPS